MIVLQASHIEKQFDGTTVLDDATLIVQARERIALIGANGAGKSTLLRILIGKLEKDAGEISVGKDVTLGYISQFVEADEKITVYEYVADAFADIYTIEKKLRILEARMALPDIYSIPAKFQTVSEEYATLQHQFEDLGGYGIEARIRRVLDGLGFPKTLQQIKVQNLSGGQKTRLSLARLLAWQPSLLVLDEPTNYLDTDTLTWLEVYLQGYEGALLMVSHDRYFLDQIATHIVELERGRTTAYTGNYSKYIEEKANRIEAAGKRYEAQQKEIAKIGDFIQKNIVRASTTKRAQSRRKMLSKMEHIDRPTIDSAHLALQFQTARPSGKDVLVVDNLTIGYENRPLAKHIQLRVARGDRVAIIGPNGTGKTTLLKTLLGELLPIGGDIQWGQHIQLGYYDQEQTTLSLHKSVLEQVWDEHPHLTNTEIRTALARFLFRENDIQKTVSALSGGERSRLNLCRLMLEQANTLLLDEPTNHLDLLSKEVLEDALSDYDGTLIFISHDRYFIDATATHIAVLSESGIRFYIGNYSDYRDKQANDEKWSEIEEAKIMQSDLPMGRTQATAPFFDKRKRIRSSDVKKAEERIEQIEQHAQENEKQQTAIAMELSSAVLSQDIEKTKSLQAKLEQLQTEEANLLEEWSTAVVHLEELLKYES